MKRTKQFILLAISAFIIASCNKNSDNLSAFINPISLPVLTTNDISSITSVNAIGGGTITDDGGGAITGRGVCYNTSPLPTVTSNVVSGGAGDGSFSDSIGGLSLNTRYYVRAYATNSAGTSYGNQVVFVATLGIGQNYEGGILYYLDNRGRHGLIVAPHDQATGVAWGCTGNLINGADGKLVGTGAQNTDSIVSGCATTGIAAYICDTLHLNGYHDWYLPSYDELQQLYMQRRVVGGLRKANYWCSTQYDASNAFYLDFSSGFQGPNSKNILTTVRAVRAF